MKIYAFLTLPMSLTIARVMTAVFFMAHAVVRILNGSIPQFGQFMTNQGLPFGEGVVWIITICEIVAGVLLIANRFVRIAASGLFIVAVGGVVLIHRHFGWFVGEHGTGGSEYSVALMVLLLVVAASDGEKINK